MRSLLISMVRFSAAMTLYGIEQIQASVDLARDGENPLKVLDKIEIGFDSLTDALIGRIGEEKRSTLQSVTSLAQDLVNTSFFDGVGVIDPKQLLRATSDMLKSSSDTVAGWVDRVESVDGEEPKPAADALG